MVYVNSRAEKKVSERLSMKGIMNYVPLRKEIRIWSDRKKTIKEPMIKGYVFVMPKNFAERDFVLQQHGVIQYLRFNGEDAQVREEEIEVLRSIENKGYHVEGSFADLPTLGDLTVIKYGPFKGLKGKVVNFQNQEIYNVLIESIGYNLVLKLPKETLSKG